MNRLLVDVLLPGIDEVFAGELGALEDGRQLGYLERSGDMIGGNVVGWVGPLRIAGRGEDKDGEAHGPAAFDRILHGNTLPKTIVVRERVEEESRVGSKCD